MTDDTTGVTSALGEALQQAFNDNSGDLGANLLGDWVVVAEVHTGDGPVLRLVSNDNTPIWRQQGMLTFALGDLNNDVLVYRLSGGENGDD